MDIADVDLNLLVVFDALLRNRSVSGAARALKMSQPATSFALNRLRKMFGEPLFVRTSRGIHPTPFAESLTAPLEAILDRIRSDLLQQPTFDPATETFEPFVLPSPNAQVRQLLGRPGEVWGAESGTDKLVVIRRTGT